MFSSSQGGGCFFPIIYIAIKIQPNMLPETENQGSLSGAFHTLDITGEGEVRLLARPMGLGRVIFSKGLGTILMMRWCKNQESMKKLIKLMELVFMASYSGANNESIANHRLARKDERIHLYTCVYCIHM